MNRLLSLLFTLFALSMMSCDRKEKVVGLITDSAMVVSAHPLASQIGANILKKGGNAVDAAIATQFALAVAFPAAGNIGGGGFMVIREKDGEIAALDYREKAPATATTDMFLDDKGEFLSDLSTDGHLASGVPGSVDGMITAHERYGTLPWKELVQPAIDLALQGIPVTKREAGWFNDHRKYFEKHNTVPPTFLYRDVWKEGDTVKWIEMGHTLELIRDNGRAGFYEGVTAGNIVAEMTRGKGLISLEDLKNYKSIWREPVTGTYRDYRIISMPPSSSGGICLIQLLKSVESFAIGSMGHNTAASVHLMVEAERRVYADRSEYLGDPDFYNVPTDKLLAADYNRSRMQDFDRGKATPSEEVKPGKIAVQESEETTHFSIVDKWGNAVAVTTTLNGWFGSYVVVGGSGFFLNNEMDDFSAKPGVPNMYGVLGGEANKIEPGKRMLSAMTPTIVEKDGNLLMVLGTPGGSTIITSVFQVIVNIADFKMGMQEAVNAPRVHSQWYPDVIAPEKGAIGHEDSLKLVELGHKITPRNSIGRVDAILVLKDGRLEAGADGTRGDDSAAGY
jgi:gamma-glutamyltranspeptidase/glutathione hydrolase